MNNQRKISNFVIYVLVSNDKKCFVGKCTEGREYATYKAHVSLKYVNTKIIFSEAKERMSDFPILYTLEKLNVTQQEAYGHVVAWIKYMIDQGFDVAAHKSTLAHASDLTESNMAFYLTIKDMELDSVLADDKKRISNYIPREKSTDSTKKMKRIYFTPSWQEREYIYGQAKKQNISASTYAKKMTLAGKIYNIIDFGKYINYLDEVMYHVEEIRWCYADMDDFAEVFTEMREICTEIYEMQHDIVETIRRSLINANKV